jgi:hypothetical protein
MVEVIKALRAIGCSVYHSKLPLDLIVAHRGRTLLMECKEPNGKLTQTQADFMDTWQGEMHIVQGPFDAVAAVIGKEAMK